MRAVRWRGSGVPFPGLAERAADGSRTDGTDGTGTAAKAGRPEAGTAH